MRTVLIVDDEPITRMDLAGMLEEEGYQVIGEAGDGFDAVELCRKKHPDVVLMDVKMPVFDGLAASRTIMEEESAGCVVLLTAFSDRAIVEEAGKIGVTGYLVKPVQQHTLVPVIEVAIAQSCRLKRSEAETQKAQKQLEDSKLIRQAQKILAEKENISESEAYNKLRTLSMEKRQAMPKLAGLIIEQERQSDIVYQTKRQLMKNQNLSEQEAFDTIKSFAKLWNVSKEEAAKRIMSVEKNA